MRWSSGLVRLTPAMRTLVGFCQSASAIESLRLSACETLTDDTRIAEERFAARNWAKIHAVGGVIPLTLVR